MQLAPHAVQRWHQSGDALLTLEAAREWVSEMGLVLFAPRAHQLATPAPSLVEATLGPRRVRRRRRRRRLRADWWRAWWQRVRRCR